MTHEVIDDNVRTSLQIDGEEWLLHEAEVRLRADARPNYVDMLIIPSDDVTFSGRPGEFKTDGGLIGADFTLDVETDISTQREGEQETRIFTGTLSNISFYGNGLYEALAFDPTKDALGGTDFMQRNVTFEYSVTGDDERKISVKNLVRYMMDIAEIDDFIIDLQKGGTSYEKADGTTVSGGYNPEIAFTEESTTFKTALERAKRASNSVWWIDRFGRFRFGFPRPNLDIESWELRFITDTSAGKQTPPYQSVKVIGDGIVSEEGWSRATLINENPIVARRSIREGTEELQEPVFEYRNLELSTQEEVDNVRDSLIDELKKERASGWIEVVGFPEVWPYDSVQMPDTKNQPMGGERYGILEVVHRLNSSDGFTTRLNVGGLIGSQEALYEDELAEEVENFLEGVVAETTPEGLAQGDGI